MRAQIAIAAELAALFAAAPACGPADGAGGLGFAGRVVAMNGPDNVETAQQWGCASYGQKAGSGLNNALLIAGGLEQQLAPNMNGAIRLIILAFGRGLEETLDNPGGAATVDFRLAPGVREPDGGFRVRTESSGAAGAPEWGGYFSRASISPDRWISTDEISMVLPIPIFSDFLGRASLSASRFTGRLARDAAGLNIEGGVLTGYVTQEAITDVVRQVRDACAGPRPPGICESTDLTDMLEDIPGAVEFIARFMGGYDVRIEGDHPFPCDSESDPTACNAISACFLIRITGVTAR